jgi:hypothetical protein
MSDQKQMTAEERLEQMYKEQKQKQKNMESSEFGDFSPEDKYVMAKGHNVVRFVGIPEEIFYSFIKDDDDKYFKVVLPNPSESPNHLLYRLMDQVLVQSWEGTDKNNKAIISTPVAEEFPEIYQMVYNNGETTEGKYGPNGWGKWRKRDNGKRGSFPSNHGALMNVIPRSPSVFTVTNRDKSGNETKEEITFNYESCKEMKHTLLLARSGKSSDAPITVLQKLFNNMMANYGNFLNYDISIERLSEDPWYNMYKADTLVANDDVKPYVVEGPLTDEEKSWETYDVSELSKPTPMAEIYKRLKNKIKKVDDALGTTFLHELEELVQEEGVALDEGETKADLATETTPEPTPAESTATETSETQQESEVLPEDDATSKFNDEMEQVEQAKKEVKEEAQGNVRVRPVKNKTETAETSVDWDKVKEATFKRDDGTYVVDELPEDQKKMITGVNEKGEVTFKDGLDLLASPYIENENKMQPFAMDAFCIYTGIKFE